MRRSFRRNRRQLKPLTDISMTSMIDTAWTLLVIFIIAAPIMQHGIKVELPQGSVKEHQQRQKDLMVFIDKAGAMYFEGQTPLSLEQMITALKKAATKDKKTVIVKADEKAVCGQLFALIDKIKQIDGIQHVVFATQNKSKQA